MQANELRCIQTAKLCPLGNSSAPLSSPIFSFASWVCLVLVWCRIWQKLDESSYTEFGPLFLFGLFLPLFLLPPYFLAHSVLLFFRPEDYVFLSVFSLLTWCWFQPVSKLKTRKIGNSPLAITFFQDLSPSRVFLLLFSFCTFRLLFLYFVQSS